MAQRKRRTKKKGPGPKRAKSKPASDTSKLLWLEIMTPAKQIQDDVTARLLELQSTVVNRMAKEDGIDLSEGWVYNAPVSRWEMPNATVG